MGIEKFFKILSQSVDILATMSYTIMVYICEPINVSRELGDLRMQLIRNQLAAPRLKERVTKRNKYADIKSIKGDFK